MKRIMRSLPNGFLFAVVAAALISSAAFGQIPGGCVTSECHSTMGTKPFVHGPVGVGACTVCHVPDENDDHAFTLMAEKEELCFACHETKRDLMAEAAVHKPVADGTCTACHDPHQAEYRYNLKGEGSGLCFQCHDRKGFEGKTVHGPVNAGACNACHDPHASPFSKQLLADRDMICFNCHKDKEEEVQKRHPHSPAEDSCLNCHGPHVSEAQYLLDENTPGLCFLCHEDILSDSMAATPHPPVASGACMECHNPHGTDFPRMFKVEPEELCFTCHTELGDYVASQEYKHGPVKQGDCNACHNPHGSMNHRILRKNFPKEFYTPYAEEKYALCFECHNSQIAKEAETETLTEFRDGSRNLHFVHVNKDVKGRSCRACHQVHASNQEKHIRTSVPYGSIDWELPVIYKKESDGGSCQVGCHAPKGYKR